MPTRHPSAPPVVELHHEPTIGTHSVFPRRLLELRKTRGWSQPELAAKIGTSGTIIGRYERGLITPSIDVARRLAEVFAVTLDHLVADGGPANALQDKVMIGRWDSLTSLSRDDRDRILFVFDSLVREAQTRRAFRDPNQPPPA